MFELWQNWNSDWTKKHEEGLAYNKQKDAVANTTDVSSVANQFNILKDYTPYESDSVVAAAAQIGVTPNQYYEIYRQSKTLYKKNADGNSILDKARNWMEENKGEIMAGLIDGMYETTMPHKRATKGIKEFFFVGVDSIAQLFDRSASNFAIAMASYEDEIYRRKGESREANIEFEQKGFNKNQREFRHKLVQAEAFIRTAAGYGVERLMVTGNKLDNIFLPEKYEVDPYAVTPFTDRANAYLMARGAVDENGVPLMQQSDAVALYNAIKLDAMDDVAQMKRQGKDVNTQDYMDALTTAYVDEAIGDYQSGAGFMEWFNFSDAVVENRIRNEMLEEFQISTNVGDFASYLFTGNMPGRYSPENVYYEAIQKEYDDKILATEMAFRDEKITVDQKNEYIANLEQQKDDALNDIAFEPNKGVSGVLGGMLNMVKYYWTDPFIIWAKGFGILGRGIEDAADVFASAQKRIKQWIDEGGGDEKAFWAQPENDEVLDGISDLVVTVNNKEGSTAFLDYVNLGLNAKFAAKLADATDAQTVKQYLVDGIDKGYLSDMVYGAQSIGNAGQYRIQSKVLNSNFLKGLADADVDDGVTAAGWRGGSRKSNSLFQNIKELFNGTDVRLAVTGEIDLNNINEAATLFARMGNLLKVPETRLNKLLTDFYSAVDEGRYFAAQEIYWDGLIRGEGALQMKYLYGFSDMEIADMFGAMGQKHRMYTDQTASFMNPSKNPRFYDPDEIHIFAKRQAEGQFKGDIPQEFLKQTLELFSDFKMNTLEIPDLITLIKATTQKRRLRAKMLIEKEGIDKVFDTARKAFDEGKSGTFWDADTPLGKIVSEVMDEVGDPSALFTKTESTLSAIEKGVFGGVRSVFYPLQLLFRLSYPAKLALEGNMRVAIFGARSIFRSPIGFFRHMLNDPDGNLARIFNIDVTTSLQGPFAKRRPKEFGGSLATLNDKLPLSVRKFLGVFTDNSEYGFAELGQATSASPMWTFRRNRGQSSQYELVNKRGQTDVPVGDNEVQDFVLDDAYVDSFAEFMFKYIDDDMAAITAGLILKGYSVEDIALYYQKTPAVRQLIEDGNKMMQNRNLYQGGTLPIVTKTEDFADLARHYKQLIDNYTGQHQEFIEIIATGKVNSHDLRSIETTTDKAYDAYYAYVKPKVVKYQDDLPNQIPRAIKEEDTGTKFQNFMDALFYATAQVEADLIRIPFIRQAYDHFIEAGIPFMTPAALAKALKNHNDNLIPVNLSDDIMDLVRAEYDKVKNIAADISVTEKTVPVKIFENKVDGVVDSYSLIAYSADGQLTVTSLKNLSKSNDSIILDLNIYDAELKVFKKQSVVAEYRLGDDGDKIGVYNLKLNANETIVDGVLTDFQKTSLTNQLSKALDSQTDVDALIDEALEYLADTQSLTTVLDKATLFKLLGLDNYNHNLQGYAVRLRKGKVKQVDGKIDVGPATLNRVIGKKSARKILTKKSDVEDAIERAYLWIQNNPDGWSLDLGRKKFNRVPGYYLSVYGSKSVVIPKEDLTREIVEKFIKDNKTLLKKQDHVLGGWVDDDGMLHLDVSIRIRRGVAANAETGTDEALAKAQYLAILADQQSISNISSKGVQIINTMDNHAAFDVVRRKGQDLLIGAQKKVLPRTQPVVANASDLKVVGNDVLELAGIRAILDRKGGTVEILKPYTNPITNQRTFSGDYQSMLDLQDIKSSTTNRVMSYEDLHERAVEYAMEIHSRVLYNLVERGYFSQAYRVGFAFFEAYREVLGRYMNLAVANPKAAAQLQLAYRKGLEENYIYTDDTGDQYLIVPVGGTPFEDLIKSEGRGVFTDDMATTDSKIIAKRMFPINALLVGGGGLFPPLGPALALGIGPLLNDKPQLRRVLQKTVFGGFPIESAEAESYFSTEFIAAIGRTTMPSVGKNMLQTIATNAGTYGMDEDAWLSSINTAYQVAGLVRPDLADDPEELQEVAMVLATNYYQLKTWDRFVNPFVPRLTVMYAIEGNEALFWDWYGKEGEDSGLEYNNFVEISAIHGFYQDLRDEYTMLLGAQGEYYALYEMTKLFGLDSNNLSEDFSAAGLQVKGKNISEGGRLPRTRPEYDFILDNPELAAEYGPVLVYFAQGLDAGATDMGTMDYIKNLGLFRPKTPNEFFYSVQTFLASAIESGQKDYWGTVIDNSTLDPQTRRLRREAKFAEIDANMRKLFPMAYGSSAELNKVLGFDYETGVKNDVMIDYFTRAVNDPRFANFDMTPTLKVYIKERDIAISAVMKSEGKTRQQAINFIIRSDSDGAQRVREQLFTKAQEIGRNNPLFLVVFNEVFSYELTRFGIEG